MGLTLSLMQTLGFSGAQSISTDQIFNQFFSNVETFEQFHIAFIDACDAFNSVMPGKRVKAPPMEEIEKCFKEWEPARNDPTKKDLWREKLKTLMVQYVMETKEKEDTAVVMTGMVAPAAAMLLKKSGENVPQLKKFRLNLIPDVVFVPSFTVLALMGVKVLQVKRASKTAPAPAPAKKS